MKVDNKTILTEHAKDCEQCQLAIETFPDLAPFDHQLCTAGQRVFRGEQVGEQSTERA